MKYIMFYIFLVCYVYSKVSMFFVLWLDIVDYVSKVISRIFDFKLFVNNVYLNILLLRFQFIYLIIIYGGLIQMININYLYDFRKIEFLWI